MPSLRLLRERFPIPVLLSWGPLLAALGLVLYHQRAFLGSDVLPARGDPALGFRASDLTPQFWPWALSAIRALWDEGTLALWNPWMTGGGPQLASPSAGVVSLTTLLGGVLAPDAALRASMLLHLLAGMVGAFAMGRALRVGAPAAAVGALAFGLGPLVLERFNIGHLNFLYPLSLMPWVFLLVWKALHVERNGYRWALAAGAIVGVQLLEGGDVPLVYEEVALATLAVGVAFGPARLDWLRRLATTAVFVALAALAVGAHQLGPMLSYVQLTGRQGGLPLELAKLQMEGSVPFFGALPLAVLAFGALALAARGERRAALWLATVLGLAFAIARSEAVFAFFFRTVPGFGLQRIPSRALLLGAVVAPILFGAAVHGVWALFARWRWVAAPAAATLAAVLAWSFWRDAPPTPPMAPAFASLDANHAMKWLQAHAAGSRIHLWESNNRHWGADNVTLPLGLEVLASYQPVEHHDFIPSDFDGPEHRSFLSESYAAPARFWGLLDVRYVTSMSPRREPGFRLAARVPPCPVETCQPAKSAGPFIYENEQWLPRVYRVPRAVAVVGPSRPAFEAVLDILRLPEFDPARVVVLQVEPGETLPAVAATVSAGVDVDGLPRWGSAAARAVIVGAFAAAPPATAVAGEFAREGPNGFRARHPGEGWLVVSERLKLFPGWRADADGKDVPIYRANGVVAAFAVGPGTELRARYRPPGLLAGAALLGLAVAGLAGFEVLRSRRRAMAGTTRREVLPGAGRETPR